MTLKELGLKLSETGRGDAVVFGAPQPLTRRAVIRLREQPAVERLHRRARGLQKHDRGLSLGDAMRRVIDAFPSEYQQYLDEQQR